MCSGDRLFPSAWVCIRMLRHLGCALPIELWQLWDSELSAPMRAALAPYDVRCVDAGEMRVQLLTRHWIITDAESQVQEVRGKGVVGEQPLLRPKESFEYTSGTAIATPVGTMRGSYRMIGEDGTEFDAQIPEFTLSIPRVLH